MKSECTFNFRRAFAIVIRILIILAIVVGIFIKEFVHERTQISGTYEVVTDKGVVLTFEPETKYTFDGSSLFTSKKGISGTCYESEKFRVYSYKDNEKTVEVAYMKQNLIVSYTDAKVRKK